MDRRNFLHTGSLTGLGLLAASLPGMSISGSADPLEEATIAQLQEQMRSGKTTAVALTRAYINRIRTIDQQGPTLKSVIELNPDALSIAASLDNERKQGKIRGPLHGIPILVKDNINTGDKMMTTAGSLALEGNKAATDAFIIRQLRNAGAVLLGKTNLSEWANLRSNRSTSGWSSRGGQTRSPYILDRNPSGSSSGSAVAAAANLCAVSIGTETDGSIVSPASVNGVVGIKPTVGLWSRSGIIPISATQDTAGPIARTVTDAAILLGALTGVDAADAVTKESEGKSHRDYTSFLDKNALKGKRIGIEKSHFHVHEDLAQAFRTAIDVLKAQGAVIVEVDLMKAMEPTGGNAEFEVLLYEFKDGVNRYLAGTNGKNRSLNDVIAFNKAHASATMPFFKQETLIESNSRGDLNSQDYKDALKKTLSSRQIITDMMAQHQLDALAGITNSLAGCIDLVNGDYYNQPSMSTPAAIAGFPHITVPMCSIHGLPAGLSFFSTAYKEGPLIGLAYAFEQATHKRQAPAFRKDLLG
ncbi:MAG TPA: amidase [Chitinophaga sp.]|uniref:amidase n=1 Tax=Chitinophaga sp. TaxID=1869181 RepID=UPI002C25B689|nr:amidase [Chitinophaga sp.]HVI48377.1 amidase [Chitinophaga sp.]